ncbi:MAG: hypothetical protein OHK0053_35940 [Microscillaceae bacterium]
MNIRVICINDKERPNEVPTTRWIKEGNVYHIIQIDKLLAQGGIYGCKLAEINNDDLAPYQYFRLDRFAVPEDLIDEEEVLNKIDLSEVEEILKEEKITGIHCG